MIGGWKFLCEEVVASGMVWSLGLGDWDPGKVEMLVWRGALLGGLLEVGHEDGIGRRLAVLMGHLWCWFWISTWILNCLDEMR